MSSWWAINKKDIKVADMEEDYDNDDNDHPYGSPPPNEHQEWDDDLMVS